MSLQNNEKGLKTSPSNFFTGKNFESKFGQTYDQFGDKMAKTYDQIGETVGFVRQQKSQKDSYNNNNNLARIKSLGGLEKIYKIESDNNREKATKNYKSPVKIFENDAMNVNQTSNFIMKKLGNVLPFDSNSGKNQILQRQNKFTSSLCSVK